MTEVEKFRILSELGITKAEMKKYFYKRGETTPLPILYYFPEKESFSAITNVSDQRSAYAVGIVLNDENIVLFRTINCFDIEETEHASAIIKERFTEYTNARITTKKDMELLRKNKKKYEKTRMILSQYSVEIPIFPKCDQGWEDDESILKAAAYCSSIDCFLVFADFPH